jgi:hypothetical protein
MVNTQLHVPAALLLGEEPQYPLDRRSGGPRNRSEACEKNSPYRNQTSVPQVVQPVAFTLLTALLVHKRLFALVLLATRQTVILIIILDERKYWRNQKIVSEDKVRSNGLS